MSTTTLSLLGGGDQITTLRQRAAQAGRLAAELAAKVSDLTEQVAALAARPATEPVALLSVEDAARLLGVSRTTCFQLMREGALVSVKVGSRRLTPRSAIDAFITSGVEAARAS
ncbi:MAG: helix-turn-helix domain-containing protein [Acidimicrobiales bacterium]